MSRTSEARAATWRRLRAIVFALTSAGLCLGTPIPGLALAATPVALPVGASSTPAGLGPVLTTEVTVALRHLVGPPATAKALVPYVQGMGPAMAESLAEGAAQTHAVSSYLLADGTVTRVTNVRRAGSIATFDFYISNSSARGYTQEFLGTAVLSAGRWKLSWVTACMLVEQEGVICPGPPAGVRATVPLPYSVTAEDFLARQVPGLLRAGLLAVQPNGDLLIEDPARDQILSLSPAGILASFAGNGIQGFAGDGGPASSAEIAVEGGGGLAVAPDGRAYLADGGNCRIREVSAGVISTFAHNDALCQVAGIAVSPRGTVFVATPAYVDEVSAGGRVTRVAGAQGSTTSDRPGISPGKIVFNPGALAFDGAGNLDIWSWEPRTIFQLSPKGTIRSLGGFIYATQLAGAPDGTVLFGSHAGGLYQIKGKGVRLYNALRAQDITGLSWAPSVTFQADGVAVSGRGTVFVDNSAGNGYGDGNALVELDRSGHARVVDVRKVGGSFPAVGSVGYPAALYPRPRPAAGPQFTSCPATAGLQPFDAAATAAAKALAAHYNANGMLDLGSTDRSWWQGDFNLLGSQQDTANASVVSVHPASSDTFAAAVSTACGQELVRDSVVVDLGPSSESFAVGHLYLLDRYGHPLVYFEAS